ncbi:hypothetical protein QSJ19_08540 [Gordonia sp. ABSL11-1]|uniref:hypothetical protein n=1 Tax=Gordonia sp. ABSL11-1 TaxID=3053924 RepID=UPI0025738DB6|nr:hypothetical protein [Gordonia sp. ABSL11-1]MDL9945633.1 hypothetical protein [Gordonia sp. ABSL11-1]
MVETEHVGCGGEASTPADREQHQQVVGTELVRRHICTIADAIRRFGRGRKKLLQFSLILVGAATFLMGCLPTFGQVSYWAPALLVALRRETVSATAAGRRG